MTMTAISNGKPRKQLSDQLDRLDGILDLLAEALPQAVADACREGAKHAVRDAVFEVLTNPDLRALLNRPAPVAPPPASSPPTLWARMKARLAALKQRVGERLAPVGRAAAHRCRAVKPLADATAYLTALGWRFKKIVLIGLGVGVLTAVVSYLSPHSVAAVIGGIGGAVAALAAQVGLWVRATAVKLHLL